MSNSVNKLDVSTWNRCTFTTPREITTAKKVKHPESDAVDAAGETAPNNTAPTQCVLAVRPVAFPR